MAIIDYLVRNGTPLKVINQGLKVLRLKVGNITVLDSFSFLPMALSALPKAFNIQGETKGFVLSVANLHYLLHYRQNLLQVLPIQLPKPRNAHFRG